MRRFANLLIFPTLITLCFAACAMKTPVDKAYIEEIKVEKTDFDALWDYYNPKESEAKFRAILPEAKASGDAGYHAELLTQIARAQGLQGHFAEAHKTLDEAEAIIGEAHTKARVRILLERGRAFNSAGKKDLAKPQFDSAYRLAKKNKLDFYTVDTAHMMGIIEPPDQALEWNRIALAAAEQSKDERARTWKGSLYNNIGWTYFDKKEYEKSLNMFEKALAFRIRQGKEKEIRIARWCVAKTQRLLGQVNQALRTQQELLTEYDTLGEKDGYVYEELAECYFALDEKEQASKYFALAWAELSKDDWLGKNEPERIERLKKLGGVE
jgi:tetratricopeptide (TPR) repeat protein